MIAIIDYDIGNITAVANMLQRLGFGCAITADVDQIEQADRIILPGNGSYDACLNNLRGSGLLPVLEQKVLKENTPLLGICVGAQMLGLTSEEGVEPGLGWIDMKVRRFPDMGLPIPHMGWNRVRPLNNHALSQGIESDTRFYFVHSYYLDPVDAGSAFLSTDYGITFTSGVARKNIAGVQFHPEKSHKYGKRLLAAFATSG